MVFWILAVTISAVACAALYYASVRRPVNASTLGLEADVDERRRRLAQIEADVASGRMTAREGTAAKSELAREIMREAPAEARIVRTVRSPGRGVVLASGVAAAGLALGLYAFMGQPHLPAQPLVARADLPGSMSLDDAVLRIEAQMRKTPDDVRGWATLGPAYLQMGRYDEAVAAYRRVIELSPPSADAQSDLAEAIMMQRGGDATGEPLALFESAAALDPNHARSRFYLAGEATRTGDYDNAVERWQELLRLSTGDEPWVPAAQQGLQIAVAGRGGENGATGAEAEDAAAPQLASRDDAEIRAMVDGLDTRLKAEGGSLEEWLRLVRSHLVLGEPGAAQAAYDLAIVAYAEPGDRVRLDDLARQGGLRIGAAGPQS